MPYEMTHLIRLYDLKSLAELTKSEVDSLTALLRTLRTHIQTLEARQDTDVTALTEDTEVIDARVDSWGNEHGSLGTNIRAGQIRLIELIDVLRATLQAQIQEVSEVKIEGLIAEAGANERRRQEISQEAETRIENDSLLQEQVQNLSEACLRMSVMLSGIKGALREQKEE